MAISEKKFRDTKKKLSPNSLAFREFCKSNKIDPLTGDVISGFPANGYTIENDLDNGKVVMKKVGKRDVGPLPIYSKESAEKRVKMKTRWLEKERGKTVAKKKGGKKAPAKKAPAKKRSPRKVAKK